MPQALKTRRRWYQFGLGTMFFLVTVFAALMGWLAWEWKFVLDRRAILKRLADGKGIVQVTNPGDQQWVNLPFWRRWMGDRPIPCLILPEKTFSKDELKYVRSLFPEAEVARAIVDERHWMQSELIDVDAELQH
jgi:hypothetical protein